ncbi:MAG: hypothetical protein FJ095_03730 [Deltaproteobacteria bacterium]|nr:hypothetical protein [Deltaproteobacteria bacterium]
MIRAVRVGVTLAVSRLGARWCLLVAACVTILSSALALLVRRSSPLGAVDAVLAAFYGAVLPLVTWAALERVMTGSSFSEALWPAARFGHSRRALGVGASLASLGATWAVVAPGLVVGVVLAAPSRSSANAEAARAMWTLGLGALAYGAALVLGSSVRRPTRGRFAVLVLDYLFGSGVSILALPWPRAHLSSLAGGPLVAALSQRASSIALATIAFVALGCALLKTSE